MLAKPVIWCGVIKASNSLKVVRIGKDDLRLVEQLR